MAFPHQKGKVGYLGPTGEVFDAGAEGYVVQPAVLEPVGLVGGLVVEPVLHGDLGLKWLVGWLGGWLVGRVGGRVVGRVGGWVVGSRS